MPARPLLSLILFSARTTIKGQSYEKKITLSAILLEFFMSPFIFTLAASVLFLLSLKGQDMSAFKRTDKN